MRNLSTALALTIAASILAIGTVGSPGSAKAYACKTYPTQTVGVRKNKFRARSVARKGWSINVKANLGVPWSVWSIAKSKTISCAKINTNAGKKWRCLASAKPCLYVVQ